MRRVMAIALAFCLTDQTALADDHGTIGRTFEIAEPDLLEWIETRLRIAEEAGVIDEMNDAFRERVEQNVRRPPQVAGLGTVTEERTWLYDPSIIVPEDIADHNGVVFAHRGQRVNPLETIGLRKVYVFIDGDSRDQIAWALEQRDLAEGQISIILTNGAPLELMEEHQVRFFFDQGGALTHRFAITAVPASMRQEGSFVRLTEHGPSEWEGLAND